MNTDMKPYTVVEVKINLADGASSPALTTIIADQLEEYGSAGSELTEAFDQVNYFENVHGDNQYFVNFLGPTHEFDEIKAKIVQFLDELLRDLKDEEIKEEWEDIIGNHPFPEVLNYEILIVRPYEY